MASTQPVFSVCYTFSVHDESRILSQRLVISVAASALILAISLFATVWDLTHPEHAQVQFGTCLDGSNPPAARQLRFLQEAAAVVPVGASYTLVAGDRQTEKFLFMLSMGVLLDRTPAPFFYRQNSPGPPPDYALGFSISEPPTEGLDVVARVTDGIVYRARK